MCVFAEIGVRSCDVKVDTQGRVLGEDVADLRI